MALLRKFVTSLNRGVQARIGDVLNDLHGTILAVPATSGTPGTTSNVAHGLVNRDGSKATPARVLVARGNIYVVSYNDTNVVVASNAATQTGDLLLIPASDDDYLGPRRDR